MTHVKSKKGRNKQNRVLLEGKRLILDALKAGAVCENIYFSKIENLGEIKKYQNLNSIGIYKVVYRHLQTWSDLSTCPGIMGKVIFIFLLRN